ncbi:hypothetical protein RZS08_00090, partial [Arthrospira platensis SPKY1]|nr:hypothetical protein [Arthrospira platensis SPKY1]
MASPPSHAGAGTTTAERGWIDVASPGSNRSGRGAISRNGLNDERTDAAIHLSGSRQTPSRKSHAE